MQKEPQNNKITELNSFLGVLWGGVLGDVIGAHLEFDFDITQNKIKKAFTICGGGKHNLQPGQPTDDSQLSYAISRGLCRGNGTFNLNFIAQEMANWFLSKPIDIGGTIRKSVPKACNMKTHQAHLCRKGAKQGSQTSQSNGSLMCIGPLGIWVRKLEIKDVLIVVKQFTIITHPNEVVREANTFFIILIHYLLNHSKDQDRNIKAYDFAKENSPKSKQFQEWLFLIDRGLEKKQTLLQELPANKKSGWMRIAFTYAIYQLLKGTSFSESIKDILRLKGDTDTNACIAGYLLGAYYGFKGLNLDPAIKIIQKWRPKKVNRPDWMVPGLVIQKYALKLSSISPHNLEMVGSSIQYQKQK